MANSNSFAILSSELLPGGRFRLEECRTRFGDVCWMVHDLQRPERIWRRGPSMPAIIRQAASREEAVAGLAN